MRRIVVAAAATLAVLAGGPAYAESWSAKDRAHDVAGYRVDFQHKPCPTVHDFKPHRDRQDDLRELSADHTATSVVLTATFADLRSSSSASAAFHVRTPDQTFLLEVVQRKGPKPYFFFSHEPQFGKPDKCGASAAAVRELHCNGLTGETSTTEDVVTVTVPRSCLHDPAWVRVGVATAAYRHGTSYVDRWSRGGPDSTGFIPPLGPRVHAAPA